VNNISGGTTNNNFYNNTGTPNPGGTPIPGDGSDNTGGECTGSGCEEQESGEGSASGGADCTNPPVTDGDAILGKIAELTWRARCAWDATGLDSDEGTTEGSIFTTDDEPADFDQSGFGLSRDCPEPPTFSLGGASATLDFEGLCTLGDIIAAIVLLLAFAHGTWAFVGR
jgi:hypothetical protein